MKRSNYTIGQSWMDVVRSWSHFRVDSGLAESQNYCVPEGQIIELRRYYVYLSDKLVNEANEGERGYNPLDDFTASIYFYNGRFYYERNCGSCPVDDIPILYPAPVGDGLEFEDWDKFENAVDWSFLLTVH